MYIIKASRVVIRVILLHLYRPEGHSLSQLRIPGVLQRFAISYFVVALTELLTSELYSWKKVNLCW